jgi:peptidoglycan/xylan/chitin deacetylase (PgdA/CDA1 family)
MPAVFLSLLLVFSVHASEYPSQDFFSFEMEHQLNENYQFDKNQKAFASKSSFPLGSNWKINGVPKNTIFLTFDDGPTGKVTNEVLAALRDYGARATFFVIGRRAARHHSLMKQISSEGHAVANHTYNHKFSYDRKSEFAESLLKTNDVIAPYTYNSNIMVFRSPGGVWKDWRKDMANSHPELKNMVGPIFWNVGGGKKGYIHDADWKCWNKNVSPKRCADGYLEDIYANYKRGTPSIVLMHDLHMDSARLIREMLRRLSRDSIDWNFALLDEIPVVQEMFGKKVDVSGRTPSTSKPKKRKPFFFNLFN